MNIYVSELTDLDTEIIALRQQLDHLHAKQEQLDAQFAQDLDAQISKLENSNQALFTEQIQQSESNILQSSQAFHHSSFSILSNAKITLQLVSARQSVKNLENQLQILLQKSDTENALRLLCNAYEASRLLRKNFRETQRPAIELLEAYFDRQQLNLLQPSDTLTFQLARMADYQQIQSQFIFEVSSPPQSLNLALKSLSQFLQQLTQSFKAANQALMWTYQQKSYHQICAIYGKIAGDFQRGVGQVYNCFIALVAQQLHQYQALFSASEEQRVYKIQFVQTAINLLCRFQQFLAQEAARDNQALGDFDAQFLCSNYGENIGESLFTLDLMPLEHIVTTLSALFLEEASDYVKLQFVDLADENLLGNAILQALEFVQAKISEISAKQFALQRENLSRLFTERAIQTIQANIGKFNLQSAYALKCQLGPAYAILQPALQQIVDQQISQQARALIGQFESEVFKFAALQDAFPLVEALDSCAQLNLKSPWTPRFNDAFFSGLAAELLKKSMQCKVCKLTAAGASLNLLQQKCTEIMHVGSAQYFLKLRQFFAVCACRTREEVEILAQDSGGDFLLAREEIEQIAATQGIE